MEQVSRIWFTPKQKAELWERWKSGRCVADIARALERRNKSGVYRVLALNGGIAPAARRRAAAALRLEEREEISCGIAAGRSIRRIEPPRRHVRRQDLEGCKTRRPADRATDQIRDGHQPQDGQGPRHRNSAVGFAAGG